MPPSGECVLAIDTSQEPLSLALRTGTGKIISFHRPLGRPHDETMLPRVKQILAKAQLSLDDLRAVAVASGTGAFTGIRIGMSYAAVLCSRLGIPALAISRLEALAFKSGEVAEGRGARTLVSLEGWRSERYCQEFSMRSRAPKALGKPIWVRAEDWPRIRSEAAAAAARIVEDSTKALELLAPALQKLEAMKLPSFRPLYLKPASFERR